MKTPRKAVPRRLERQLYQEVNNRCPMCGNEDLSSLVIHHIIPHAERAQHDAGYMIVLCANCHAKADRGEISTDALYSAKQQPRILKFPGATASQQVVGDNNMVAGRDLNVTIRGRSKRKAPVILPGTVGTDPRRAGYLKYLAKRYNQFKEWEAGRGGMKHAVIYVVYQREMKYGIDATPLPLFDTAVDWLQNRILKTKLGRILHARGRRSFSEFEEFDGLGDLSLPERLP
jgi:hypothetical protein